MAAVISNDPSLNSQPVASFAGQAGIGGFLKTMALEWPEVKCRVIHVDPTNPLSIVAGQFIQEMASEESCIEVEYRGLNRITYQAKQAPLNPQTTVGVQIEPDWVILVTGGAVGIILAVLVSKIVDIFFTSSVPLSAIVVGLTVSTGVGLFFGIYPAYQAASLRPIEALRYE